jgi:hypothetical protein
MMAISKARQADQRPLRRDSVHLDLSDARLGKMDFASRNRIKVLASKICTPSSLQIRLIFVSSSLASFSSLASAAASLGE